ncbi:MAG: homoserine kinase [Ignisphaera sp.]
MRSVRVRAYCSSANLGPGFDALAVALDAFYDEVEARVESGGSGKIVVEEVRGPYAEYVKNPTTVVGVFEVLKNYLGHELASNVDVVIKLFKGVPIGVGLGSSGASAAATIVALSNLFSLDLGPSDLAYIAGLAEGYAAGTPHFDNVAASVLGKLVALAILDKGLAVKRIDFDAWFAIAMPTKNIFGEGKTKAMREVLPKTIDLRKAVANWSRLAVMVTSAMQGDLETFGKLMELDEVVEPARAKLIPCFNEVKAAAKKTNGLGVAISGAGPSIIALARDESHAKEIANAMAEAYSKCVEAVAIVTKTARGAHILYSISR